MRQERVTRKPARRTGSRRAVSHQPQTPSLRRPDRRGDAELDDLLARIDRTLSGPPSG